jgi:hypothetical protein
MPSKKKKRVKCPECGEQGEEDLSKWPPEVDKENKILLVPFICKNGHHFIIKVQLL